MAPGFVLDGPQDRLDSHHFCQCVSPLGESIGILVMLRPPKEVAECFPVLLTGCDLASLEMESAYSHFNLM